MNNVSFNIAQEKIQEAFEKVTFTISPVQIEEIDGICSELIMVVSTTKNKGLINERILGKLERIVESRMNSISKSDDLQVRKAIVLKLASHFQSTISRLNLPGSILSVYPETMERMVFYIMEKAKDNYNFSDDHFRKDLSVVLGLFIPTTSCLLIDPHCYISFLSVIRSCFRGGNLKSIYRLFRTGGLGPWYRLHLDERDLTDWQEPQWRKHYLRIADYLMMNTHIQGQAGSSWLYDPQIPVISPGIGHVQLRQLEHGAFIIRQGTDDNVIKNAIYKSNTRKKLYDEGKYMPISCSIFWFRDDLLRRVNALKQIEG